LSGEVIARRHSQSCVPSDPRAGSRTNQGSAPRHLLRLYARAPAHRDFAA
jgi:hypothetical protein